MIRNIITTGAAEESNTTIDRALELIDKSSDNDDIQQWKVKELGFQVALLGVAEIQALRMKKMALLTYKLEDVIFGPENLTEISTSKAIELYAMSTKALADTTAFLKDILRSTKWGELELQLTALAKSNPTKDAGPIADSNVSQVSADLLTHLSKTMAKVKDGTLQEGDVFNHQD